MKTALCDRIDIHVTLPKDVHTNMRIELFKKRLSLQDALSELAAAFARGDSRAHKIVDELVTRRLEAEIAGLKNTGNGLDEQDRNTLYDLIDSGNKDVKE